MKLAAVLNARSGLTLPALSPSGLKGNQCLQSLNRTKQHRAECAECEQRARVLRPVLFFGFAVFVAPPQIL